jgi:hypothetical protein
MAKNKSGRSVKINNKIPAGVFILIIAVVGVIALSISSAAPRNRNSLTVADGVYLGTAIATLSDASSLNDPWIIATCYQGGAPVIFNRIALDDIGQATLQLGPSDGWKSGIGGADCKAEAKNWNLKRQRWDNLVTANFHVSD